MNNLNVNNFLNELNNDDTFSLALILIYLFKGLPEYSTLSELIYLLDKENFLKLIKYFGGQTITIPTEDDLIKSLKLLKFYQLHKIDGVDYDTAITQSELENQSGYLISRTIKSFEEELSKYEFNQGGLNADKK